jgi:hypothetical protein
MNQNGLMKAAGFGLLLLGVAGAAFGAVPEIDASSGMAFCWSSRAAGKN